MTSNFDGFKPFTMRTKKEIWANIKSYQEQLHQEQEKRECWVGRCPICKTFHEVETDDVKFELGFFGTDECHCCIKCLECGYDPVPVKPVNVYKKL